MLAISIVVLLICSFIAARALRSTKMWWIFIFSIIAGLLVGMLSKEAVKSLKKDNITASITQLVNTVDNLSIECTLPVIDVTEITSHSGAMSYVPYLDKLSKVNTSNTTNKGRDSPSYYDDS